MYLIVVLEDEKDMEENLKKDLIRFFENNTLLFSMVNPKTGIKKNITEESTLWEIFCSFISRSSEIPMIINVKKTSNWGGKKISKKRKKF